MTESAHEQIAKAIGVKPDALTVRVERVADAQGALWERVYVGLRPSVNTIAREVELLRLIKRELARLGYPRRVQAETAEDVAQALRRRREARRRAQAEAEAEAEARTTDGVG